MTPIIGTSQKQLGKLHNTVFGSNPVFATIKKLAMTKKLS